jgi:DNA-binding beta-propeller fold protein YncE
MIKQSQLLVLDKNGGVVDNIADNGGPWDLTINDMGGGKAQIFVANVLTGTVDRFSVDTTHGFSISSPTQIAAGYPHMSDPNAFELGPTGLAFDAVSGTLYVASTADNTIYAINNANTIANGNSKGSIVYSDPVHLHGPLGLTFAPDGNLISAQGDAVNPKPSKSSELVEFTPSGKFVGEFSVSKRNPGGAFGVASSMGSSPEFAAVNDIDNTVEVWQIST